MSRKIGVSSVRAQLALQPKVASVFRFLTGDVDYLAYGGKWYRKVADTRYHVIELTNMWEATGDKSISQYDVELSEIDITCPQLKTAMHSCGPDDEELQDNELVKVEALSSYGAGAPLGSWGGSNARKLIAEARSESRELDDPDKYEAAMSRPVNRLGSTAREYAAGDFDSAIRRGVERDDPAAKIMAKIGGVVVQPSPSSVQFGTLQPDGSLVNVRTIKHSDIGKCPHVILVPDHYREDGSCKCDDAEHRKMMIKKWGYTESSFEGIELRV